MTTVTDQNRREPLATAYLAQRGFTPEAIETVGWRVELLADRYQRYGLPAEAADAWVWVIPYRHRNGHVAFERIRLIADHDLEQFGGGKYRQPAGRPLSLYDPWQQLETEPIDALLLIEGEANAVAAKEADPDLVVVGLPGQRALRAELANELAHVPVIFVWIDAHDPSAEANAAAIARRLYDAGVDEVRLLPPAAGIDANDCQREMGLERTREVLSQMLDQAQVLAPDEDDWPSLARPTPPEFPLDALPAALAAFVEELAEATETPHDLGAVTALGVLSVAALGIKVQCGPEWIEELCLYLLVAMESGDRKSSVLGAVARPLHQLEREAREAATATVREKLLRKETLEARKGKLVRKAGDADDPDQRAGIETDLNAIAEELEQIGDPFKPRLLADDATPETLGGLLDRYKRLAVVTAEAPLISNLLGRYDSSGAANLDLVCKAYEGERTQVDRRNREEILERPLLTVVLTVQPHVLRRLVEHETARGQGLVGRFAFSTPESLLGRRRHLDVAIKDETRQGWEDLIRHVYSRNPLTEPTQKVSVGSVSHKEIGDFTLLLSSSATKLLHEHRVANEARLAEGGELRPVADWFARHHGRVARIAALLHVADRDAHGKTVSETTMRQALRIGDYLLAHGVAVLTEPDGLVRRALRWLERAESKTVTIRDLQRGPLGGGSTAEQAHELADRLVKIGALRAAAQPTTGRPGRPPSPSYEVNPKLWKARRS
jgi:hypothetical protein